MRYQIILQSRAADDAILVREFSTGRAFPLEVGSTFELPNSRFIYRVVDRVETGTKRSGRTTLRVVHANSNPSRLKLDAQNRLIRIEREHRPSPVRRTSRRRTLTIAKGKTALICDDEPLVLDVARRTLERFGMSTIVSTSSTEVRGLIQSGRARFDLLIADIVMPEVNGVELCEDLRAKHGHEIPTILMSGFSEHLPPARSRTFTLEKPWLPSRLADVVSEALSTRPPTSDRGLPLGYPDRASRRRSAPDEI